MRTIDVVVVGVVGREQLLVDLLPGQTVRCVVHVLAAFVPDYVLLITQRREVHCLEQKTHPVTLGPQSQLKLIGRHVLQKRRAVQVGVPVDPGRSYRLQGGEVVTRPVPRLLQHHVLEKVGEAPPAFDLVRRSHCVPDVHRGDRDPVILPQDDVEPVVEGVVLELEIRLDARNPPVRPDAGGREQRHQCKEDPKPTRAPPHGPQDTSDPSRRPQ